MSAALSGINSNVLIGSNDIDSSGWSADIEANTFDSTTTADLGWEDTTPSTKKVSGSFDFLYNPAKKPTGATIGITPGTTIANLVLWIVNPGGDSLAGKALITKLSLKQKTAEGFTVTASFVSKGVWILPS